MPTKVTFIIDNPADPAAFEQAWTGLRPHADELPKIQRVESAKVWPKEDGTPTPAYRQLDLYFASYEDASAAVTTPAAGALVGGLVQAGVTFTGLFSDIEA